MTLEVNGFGDRPMAPADPVPQSPGAAPAAPVHTQPPDVTGAMQPQTNPPAPAQAPAVPSTPVVLFGRTFSDSAQAEEYARHMVRSAENRNKAELERLRSVATQTPQPQPTVPPAAPEAAEPEGAYDIKTYMLVKSQYGEEAAEHYRSQAIAENLRKTTESMLAERLAPFEQTEEMRRTTAHAQDLFSKATEAVGSNGMPLLPELRNPAEADAIVKIWQGLPMEFAVTPQGVWHATMVYRGAKAQRFGTPTPPPPVPQPSGQSVDSSAGPSVGFVPGQPQQDNIPRPSSVNPLTGERYFRS